MEKATKKRRNRNGSAADVPIFSRGSVIAPEPGLGGLLHMRKRMAWTECQNKPHHRCRRTTNVTCSSPCRMRNTISKSCVELPCHGIRHQCRSSHNPTVDHQKTMTSSPETATSSLPLPPTGAHPFPPNTTTLFAVTIIWLSVSQTGIHMLATSAPALQNGTLGTRTAPPPPLTAAALPPSPAPSSPTPPTGGAASAGPPPALLLLDDTGVF